MRAGRPPTQIIRVAQLARSRICVLLILVTPACNSPKSATADAGEETGRTRAATAPTSSPSAVATIEGSIRVSGKIPSLPPLQTSDAVARVCGVEVPDRTLAVGEGGGLADAVVFLAEADVAPLDGPASGRSPAVIDQRKCEYWPPVVAVRAGTEVEFRNSDPLLHNVHGKDSGAPFNFAMPVQGLTVRKALPRSPEVLRLSCDVHPWMRAVVRTFNHPYFALTDARGHYRLSAVPAGRRKLGFWHQRFPEKTIELEALPSRANQADLEWSANELRR